MNLNDKKILITGANGQLGKVLVDIAPSILNNHKIITLSPMRDQLDISSESSWENYLKINQPDWIVNTAAYTKVDQAESEAEKAFKVNGESTLHLCKNVKKFGCKVIHISTDSVFSSNQKTNFKPNSNVNPVNIYGLSKLLGERNIADNLFQSKQGFIIRTSWLMGYSGSNFLNTIVNLHQNKKLIKVVSNQFGYLTSSNRLAKFCWDIIRNEDKYKSIPSILHYCNDIETTWFEIAKYIGDEGERIGLFNKKAIVQRIDLEDFIAPAPRSKYCLLDTKETRDFFKLTKEPWQNIIKEELKKLKESK